MDPKPSLKLNPERRLIMTYALRQSLEILQMPQLELAQWLRDEIEKNPLLELHGEKKGGRLEAEIPMSPTLHEHIENQIRENFMAESDRELALQIVEQLDEKGFISASLETIIQTPHSSVLSVLQTFDPPGIFARDLQESLLIQLRRQNKEQSPTYFLIEHAFEDLLHGRYESIKKKIRGLDISAAMEDLSRLSLRPAAVFKGEPIQPIHPDLMIVKIEGGWTLELIEDELPQFRIEEKYLAVDPETREERETMQDYKMSAQWIFRSLQRRRELLRKIGRIMICRQAPYLSEKGPLAELTILELTEKLQIHESTLSRALSGKYASTPRGIIPLRSLISSSPESDSARHLLEKLIAAEDKKQPLTDDELADRLKVKGVRVARRTIAKYRSQLKIGPASQRKHLTRRRPTRGPDDGTKSP